MNREHDYSGLVPRSEETLYNDVANAINYFGLWTWLREYGPNYDNGFDFYNHPYLDPVRARVSDMDDYTFYRITRVMETIAKTSWDDWVETIVGKSNRMW